MGRPDIKGEMKITKRIGDVYFGEVLQPLPVCPPVYRRFIPEDYESQIPLEERTVKFLNIGFPKCNRGEVGPLRLDSNLAKFITLLLENPNQDFSKAQLKERLGIENLSTLDWRVVDEFRASEYFEVRREKQGKECNYRLEQKQLSDECLKKLEEIDIRLGFKIEVPIDSLDSARL